MVRRLVLSLGLGIAVLALLSAPVGAQTYPFTPPETPETPETPAVSPGEAENPLAPAPTPTPRAEPGVSPQEAAVAGDVVTRSLPITGGDLIGLAAMGAGALAIGGLLVAQRRRRTT